MKQFFKTCHVFRRPEGYFIFGVINTAYGGITVPPAAKLPLGATASSLGEEIIRILKGLPNHLSEVDLATARQPFLAYLRENGFKNPAVFEKKASMVAVHYDGEVYEVVPHQKADQGGFVAMASTKSPCTSSEGIGNTVFSALEAVSSIPPAKA